VSAWKNASLAQTLNHSQRYDSFKSKRGKERSQEIQQRAQSDGNQQHHLSTDILRELTTRDLGDDISPEEGAQNHRLLLLRPLVLWKVGVRGVFIGDGDDSDRHVNALCICNREAEEDK
jgi:hypothetical protein